MKQEDEDITMFLIMFMFAIAADLICLAFI
jgi:hypothetical protein